jgi:hypothetical protein
MTSRPRCPRFSARDFVGRPRVAMIGREPTDRALSLSLLSARRLSNESVDLGRLLPSARSALVEAAWSTVLQPGPLHALYQRTKARRGHEKAIVATARKLSILFWCMLTRGQDYPHQPPTLTNKKLRRLEITAGAPKNTRSGGVSSTKVMMREASARSPSRPRCPTSEWSKTSWPAVPQEQWARA